MATEDMLTRICTSNIGSKCDCEQCRKGRELREWLGKQPIIWLTEDEVRERYPDSPTERQETV